MAAAEEIGLVGPDLGAMSGIASFEAEAGDAIAAARLWGWIDAQASRLGATEDDELELELESLRDALGPERLTSELATGAAMSREEAIDLALGRGGDPAGPVVV